MRVNYNGYASGYTPGNVRKYANRVALAHSRACQQLGFKARELAVVVRGNSGVSVAFAALMVADFPLILARKHNDESHGELVEGPLGHNFMDFVICDDLVASGSTVEGILKTMADYEPLARCHGLLLYRSEAQNTADYAGLRQWCQNETQSDVVRL